MYEVPEKSDESLTDEEKLARYKLGNDVTILRSLLFLLLHLLDIRQKFTKVSTAMGVATVPIVHLMYLLFYVLTILHIKLHAYYR